MKNNEVELLNGYNAMFRGAYESGASFFVTATKSFNKYPLPEYEELKVVSLTDERNALSYAFGLALSGKRVVCFLTSIPFDLVTEYSYTGINGSLILVYLEDNDHLEYDSRPFFKACGYPIFEPADPSELKRFVKISFNFSEKYDVPVVIRTSRRLFDSLCDVPLAERKVIVDKPYKKDSSKYVLLPSTIKLCAEDIVQRNVRMTVDSEGFPINQVFDGTINIGVIASGEVARSVREAMPDYNLLCLGMSNPLPINKIKEFAQKMDKLYIIEEHPFLENILRNRGIECVGEDLFPRNGRRTVKEIAAWIMGKASEKTEKKYGLRTPDFCNECPLVPIVFSLKKKNLPIFTDNGCGVLSGCFMSANEVGIKYSLASAIAFSHYNECISFLTVDEFISQITSIIELDISNITIVVAVSGENYKSYCSLLNAQYEEATLEEFLKIEKLKKIIYFVKVDKVCKYEM